MDDNNQANLGPTEEEAPCAPAAPEAPAAAPDAKAEKDWKNLKLNYPQTLKVGLGFAVVMIFWQVYNFVVPLLLEDAFGFSNTIRNVIVGIASAMCMVLLPLFGKLSDRSGHTKLGRRFGRRTPFIVVGTVITIVAMILVPISVQTQLRNSQTVRNNYEYFFQVEDNAVSTQVLVDGQWQTKTRAELLGEWFDMAADGNYKYLTKSAYDDLVKTQGGEAQAKAYFQSLYNVTVANDGTMGIGAKHYYKTTVLKVGNTYTVLDGKSGATTTYNVVWGDKSVKVEQAATVEGAPVEISKEQYDEYNNQYIQYSAYLADGVNDFVSAQAQTQTNWTGWFVFFLVALLFIILAQTIIRTPAVSLMPDVTPSPLRSPGNAMINLIGGVGGGIGFFIYTITFLLNLEIALQYWIIFGVMAIVLGLVLGLFILLVREKKWVARCREICHEYGLPTDEDAVPAEGEASADAAPADAAPVAPAAKESMFKKYDKKTMRSFFLILGAIFMWFLGYYSIANNMSIYCVKVLNVSAGIASIVSGASLVVAAIGFIPVGAMARKFGRRLSIIFGFLLAVVSYILVAAFVQRGSDTATVIFMVCYMVSGFGLIFANVNTLPMVLELSSPKDVGTFTGIYYIATMSAQTLGPICGGLVMDYVGGSSGVFIFAAVCVVVGAILMYFVKHGEAPDYLKLVEDRKAARLAKKAG